MADRIVLCVDDEAILLMALKTQLRLKLGDGFVCETFLNAESALGRIDELVAEKRERDVGAVISDWKMPGMKGDEFLRKVRSAHPECRLILMTGYADNGEVQALSKELHLWATFPKPCDADELASAIRADCGTWT